MHKIIIMLLFFVFWAVPAFAQDTLWSRTYGGADWDQGWSIQQTTDGGYIVAGFTESFGAGGSDVYVIKTHANGGIFWSRTYGGSNNDQGRSVQQTADGGYIVVGFTESFGAGGEDIYLIKTDASGDTLWTSTYGGDSYERGQSVQQTTDGGYIVTGWTESFGVWVPEFYLIKTDSLGDTLWTRTYGSPDQDYCFSVQQTADGGYIMAGNLWGAADAKYVYLIKTDSNGDTLWTRTCGEADQQREVFSVQQTTDGGYLVAGGIFTYASGYDVYLLKTDPNGAPLWSRAYGGSGGDGAYSVQEIQDGGYVVAGITYSFGAINGDVFVIKTNSSGDPLWGRVYGGDGWDYARSVLQTVDGGYITAGYTESFGAGSSDAMVTYLDSLGNACIGQFVSSTVISVSPSCLGIATIVTFPSFEVTTPQTIVGTPLTEINTICERVCGDITGDGVVDLGDVLNLISYLYKGGPAPDPLEVGDVDGDGIIELGDVLYLISYLYKGGSPPLC